MSFKIGLRWSGGFEAATAMREKAGESVTSIRKWDCCFKWRPFAFSLRDNAAVR